MANTTARVWCIEGREYFWSRKTAFDLKIIEAAPSERMGVRVTGRGMTREAIFIQMIKKDSD